MSAIYGSALRPSPGLRLRQGVKPGDYGTVLGGLYNASVRFANYGSQWTGLSGSATMASPTGGGSLAMTIANSSGATVTINGSFSC